jgi:hypothetical protein
MDPNIPPQSTQNEIPTTQPIPQQPVNKIPSSGSKWKLIKIIIIVAAIIICIPFIGLGLKFIFNIISINSGMSIEEAQKISEKAVGEKDLNACYKIGNVDGNLNVRYICMTSVVEEKKDQSLCKKIPSAEWEAVCYAGIAKTKGDFSLCEKISYEIDKNICYSDVAIKTNNPELCKKVGYKQLPDTDSCFYEIAINTKNQKLCDQLQDYEYHIKCINELKEK